ncbi:unnamed protein product [Caenorhabditis sp. 36 PRJEB53466]|nr:unnamed protein product [Caenorhabditis sp. 36 PRJEB53466]
MMSNGCFSQFESATKECPEETDQLTYHRLSSVSKVPTVGNVSALREIIQDRLELKTPVEKHAPNPIKPFLTSNITVHEPNGIDSPFGSHNFGRVLDGPVDSSKYFQGVPPPSYNQIKTLHNCESKPPVPRSKQSQVVPVSRHIMELPLYRQVHLKSSYKTPYNHSFDPRLQIEDMDDSASVISSCISTFGESSEIAAFSAAGEQRDLYEQYRKQFLSDVPVNSSDTPGEEISSELGLGDFVKSQDTLSKPLNVPSRNGIFEKGQITHSLPTSEDLESSQLLMKPKSPIPYSSASSFHYGTIRRKKTDSNEELTSSNHLEEYHQDTRSLPTQTVDAPEMLPDSFTIPSNYVNLMSQICDICSPRWSAKRVFWNSPKGTHFHLPTYYFRDDDPRPIRCSGICCLRKKDKQYGTPCMMCSRPRRDADFHETDNILNEMKLKNVHSHSQTSLDLIRISKNLEETTKTLDVVLKEIDKNWKRSKSQPTILLTKGTEENISVHNQQLENSTQGVLLRLETENQDYESVKSDNQFSNMPSASPTLQKSLETLNSLLHEFSSDSRTQPLSSNHQIMATATAVYKFDPKSQRELALNRGDIVKIIKNIDAYWMEGERNGRSGIFPASYVQLDRREDVIVEQVRALYPFTARNSNELSLKKGEMLTILREVDTNCDEVLKKECETDNVPKLKWADKSVDFDSEKTLMLDSFPVKVQGKLETKRIDIDKNKPQAIPKVTWHDSNKMDTSFNAVSLIPEGSQVHRVIYPYKPQKEDELQLFPNDIVFVVEKCDDGWFIGTSLRTGLFGIFPGNYVKKH